MNAGRDQPLTSPGASVQGRPLQTCLPAKPRGPARAVLVPVRAGCGKPQMCPSRQRPQRVRWGGCRPWRGQLHVAGCVCPCVSYFVNYFTSLLYVLQLGTGVETTHLVLLSLPLLPFGGFCVVLFSERASGATRHPGPCQGQPCCSTATSSRGWHLCVGVKPIRQEGEGGKQGGGGGGGNPVALAMTERRWCPASHGPGHFGSCGPLPPGNRPKNYVLQLH